MAANFSSEAVRQMMKEGKLRLYEEGDIVSTMGSKLKTIRILLNGEIGVVQQDK